MACASRVGKVTVVSPVLSEMNAIHRKNLQFVIASNLSRLTDEILAFCRGNMAPYKVPKRIVFVEQIPVTAVGKIDKKRLRATS